MPARPLIKFTRKKTFLGKVSGCFVRSVLERSARKRYRLFADYVKGPVLDIGLGGGAMAKLLLGNGFQVSSLDVDNTCVYPAIKPTLYDGLNFPYRDNQFQSGLLVCVLHHCAKQLKVLKEAMRTCRRLIIIEDVYRNPLEKLLVSARDSVGNFEFYPHQYRSAAGWQKIFKKHRWQLLYSHEWSSIETYGMYGRQAVFVIEKGKS